VRRKEVKMKKKNFLPFPYERFTKEFPEIEKEYDKLAKKCHLPVPSMRGYEGWSS
jgi:hypothetical protein